MITLIKKQFKAFMKIRNLLKKVQQKQIERNYPYIFVFHCSGLTNLQWRHLKFLLHKAQGNTFFQPRGNVCVYNTHTSRRSEAKLRHQNLLSKFDGLNNQAIGGGVFERRLLHVDDGVYLNRQKRACVSIPTKKKLAHRGSYVHPALTSSQHKKDKEESFSISFKTTQEQTISSRVSVIQQESAGFVALLANGAQTVLTEKTNQPENNIVKSAWACQSKVGTVTPLGPRRFELLRQHQRIAGPLCLLYSTQTTLDKVTSNPWFDLLTNMNSIEYKANLVLLYAHINCQKFNHIDVKELMNLDTQSVLGLFLQSINFTAHYFAFCLNSNTAEILFYEGLRKECFPER